MAKGTCQNQFRTWDSMNREEKWITCKKPANHICDHYNPPTETRWPREQ